MDYLKKKGGGVALNQIHDIDYLIFLFENYNLKLINSFKDKISNTKIDTEDTISTNFFASKKNEKFLVTLLLNSYERPKSRGLNIIGSRGKIVANLINNSLEIYRFNILANGMMSNKKISKKIIRFKFQRNDLFKRSILFYKRLEKNLLIQSMVWQSIGH